MSARIAAIPGSLALVLAVGCLFLFLELRAKDADLDDLDSRQDELAADLAALKAENERLAEELAAARARAERRHVASSTRAAEESAGESPEVPGESEEAKPAPAAPVEGRQPLFLASVSDADRVCQQLLARGDIEGLWLLAGDLLLFGDEGYEKICELLRRLERDEAWRESFGEQFQLLWRDEQLFVGPFLRAVAERDEDILRFGLHVMGKPEDELPSPLRDMRRDFDDDIAPLLLGFYDGGDAELLDAYTDRYEQALSGDLSQRKQVRDMVWGLSQIPTERSVAALLDVLERAPEEVQMACVSALAWQGSGQAVPALRSVLARTKSAKLHALIQAALRHLE